MAAPHRLAAGAKAVTLMNAIPSVAELLQDIEAADIALLPRERQERFASLLAALNRRTSRRQFLDLFPDNDNVQQDGRIIYARARYPKHIEFFKAGATYRERGFIAANRVGKTITGAYETTAHLTGLYPHWWEGKRFTGPVTWWACGKSNETTRDIVQHALLGDVTFDTDDGRKGFAGKGMIPAHLMGRTIWRRGSDDAVDNILVKHVTGGWSRVGFKSYEQKRGAFEGTARHGIWLDEECPLDIYGECLIRTATTGGIIMLTFTPLAGITDTVQQFMPGFGDD
ncbi:terminase family protein [Mesorhizobium sp.]|uniref:terminase large subunit domain-containing protein n=1 Tax=Mesorhizobium sp. TaxID=1871066 RepID=UPI0025EE02EF|nr:terminase family protein [Mesorhizobium sp.]